MPNFPKGEAEIEVLARRQALAFRLGRDPGEAGHIARRVAEGDFGLFGAGALMAVIGLDLPEQIVMGSMVIGAVTMLVAGVIAAWQNSHRNSLIGNRWLQFWQRRLGEWAAKLAGFGVTRL